MKVGVIGAGLAGLTCAYRLTQRKIKTILFEKEPIVGGRIPYCAAVATEEFQPSFTSLIKELDIEELKVPLKKDEISFFTPEGKFMGLEGLPKMAMMTFSLREMFYFMKFTKFINRLRFSVKHPDPEAVRLRGIPFGEFLKDCPERVFKIAIEPRLIFTMEKDLMKLDTDFCLCYARFINELGSGRAFNFEENNIMTVSNVLDLKIREGGSEVLVSTEVKKVESKNGKFLILFEEKGETRTEQVDKVVLATPLNITQDIFPELELETGVKYLNLKCFFVKGKLKDPKRKMIIGMPGNPANLLIILNVLPKYHLVYSADLVGSVDLEKFYTEYSVIDEKLIVPGAPLISPGARVPELETKIKGAYLCGDFYYYPLFEAAVETGEIVADLISKEEQIVS